MTQELLSPLEDLIHHTEEQSMLSRKLRNDEVENLDVNHQDVLAKIELANKHLRLAKVLLQDVSEVTKNERFRK